MLRRLATALGALFAVLVLSLVAAPAALAHVDVNKYTPALGETLMTPPVTITFEMSGDPGNIDVHLYHRDGREVPLTGGGASIDGATVTVLPPALDVGTYVVTWSSIGPDGHPAAGQTYFNVGAADGVPTDMTGKSKSDSGLLLAALQWLGYLGLAGVVGALWLRRVGSPSRLRLLLKASVGVFALATLARLIAVALAVGADSGIASGIAIMMGATVTAAGWAVTLAAVPLMLVRNRLVALAGVLLAALGVNMTGHLGSNAMWAALVPLAAVHLLAVALWIGAPLAQLVAGRRGKEETWAFASRFTLWALGAALLAAMSGVLLLALRTDWNLAISMLSTPYGQRLMLKWGVIAAVVLPLGAYHLYKVTVVKAREYQARLDAQDAAASSQPSSSGAETGEGTHPDASAEHRDDANATGESTTAKRPTLSRLTITIEVVALAVVILLGATMSTLPPKPAASPVAGAANGIDLLSYPATFEECLQGGEGDQLLCVSRYLEGVAVDQDMPAALKEITQRWVTGDDWMKKNCHAVGHKLGRLGFRMMGSIEAAFAQGSDPCDYGYLHGVIEAASAEFTDQMLLDSMATMCEPVGDITSHTYRQCIHGLGHAAARRTNNDLVRAAAFCTPYLKDVRDPRDESDLNVLRARMCITGVSMEWNTTPRAYESAKLPIGAPGTLLDECRKVDTALQAGCIEYGTSALGGKLDREIAAREWCDKHLEDPMPCYQSIGRDVIWSTTITPEQAVEVCTGGRQGEYAEQCIMRALGSVATISLNASDIDKWCPNLPEKYQGLCPIVRDAMEVQIEQTLKGYILEGTSADGKTGGMTTTVPQGQ